MERRLKMVFTTTSSKNKIDNFQKEIYLVVETPRAGEFGHRFISSSKFSELNAISDMFKRSGDLPVGFDYISVSKAVPQIVDGSVRTGFERIALMNVDTVKIKEAQVKEDLEKLLNKVEELIKLTDWEKEGKSILCVNPTLINWINLFEFNKLPVYQNKLTPPGQLLKHWLLKFILVFGVIFSCISFGFYFNYSDNGKKFNPPSPVNQVKYSKLLMDKINCNNINDFEKDIENYIVAINGAGYDKNKLENYAENFFNKGNKREIDKKKYCEVFKGNSIFDAYFAQCLANEKFDFLGLRKNINECYKDLKIISKFKDDDVINKLLQNDPPGINFFEFDMEETCDPKTPFFNLKDKKCLESIYDWLQKNNNKDLCFYLNGPANDFNDVLNKFKKNKDTIMKNLKKHNNPKGVNYKIHDYFIKNLTGFAENFLSF